MKFSIVIPTVRNPHLDLAIKSALAQNFDDYEIILSDNSSAKDHLDYKNDRIKYYKTKKFLKIWESWEFAVSKAKGDYITVLGDDCFLFPNALKIADQFLSQNNIQVLAFGTDSLSFVEHMFLTKPRTNTLKLLNSKEILQRLLSLDLSIDTLPGICSSFHSKKILEKVKSRIGSYFLSPFPDVTNAVATVALIPNYAFLDISLEIAAITKTSVGVVIRRNKSFAELEEPLRFVPIKTYTLFNLNCEAILKMKHLLNIDYKFNWNKYHILMQTNKIRSMLKRIKLLRKIYYRIKGFKPISEYEMLENILRV